MNRVSIVASLVVLAACTSPESTRMQGGGPGADTGNRRDVVFMHEGSRPYHGAPLLIPADSPALASASQADRLSRR
jgi:hypothetical protein